MPIARGSWRLGEVSGFRENSLDTGLRTFSAVTDNASIAHLSTCPCAGCMKSAAPDEPDAQIDGGSDGIPPRSELDWTIAPWAREGVGYDIARIHDGGPEQQNPGAGGDTIGNTTATAGSISIGGSQNGYVNTVGDDDWYAVTLVAGQSYAFSLTGGTLADAYLELRNSLGNLIAIDDDFGPGINSLLRFTPTTSGTYYINARGFEDDGVENTGSYTLTAATAAPASPLDSIDFHFTMPTTSIAIWFAPQGFTNPQGDTASRAWMQTEIDAVFAAAATYSAFTPLTFTLAASQAAADWILSLADLEGNVLGYFAPDNIGYGAFDPTVSGWSAGLHPGGNSWVTLIHEFGHGLGMAHPHDNSAYNYGVNNSEIMQGVTGPFGSYGTFLMNQGVFTTMGYNDSWALSGFGATPSNTTGGQSTPMALDVALMQQGYGVNPTTGSGDTAYTLALSSTSYSCIWDVSGADVISYSGSGVATIDLRAATLLNAVGGGGYVSFV
ncbi:MAG: pre-peptidase C-terminal domain-containing protein, partial [Caulobacteraceae bacterium]